MESATLTRRRPGSIWLARLRAVPPETWAAVGLRGALRRPRSIGYFAFPTYPTYDSFYALLWGRDLLHLHLPDFSVYRGPTEHPLAIAFGMFCSIFGAGRRAPDGARLDRLVRRGRRRASTGSGACASGRWSALIAALLLLSRFFVENLAAQGYLDISYVALIVWAIALEVERPRRGTPVFLLLAAGRAAAPRRVGAERRLLAVVLAGALSNRTRAEVPRAGRDRAPLDLGRARRDRDRQPAVLADRHRRARRRNSNARRASRSVALLGVDVRGTHRQAAGAARGARRAAAGVWMAPRRVLVPLAATGAAASACSSPRAPSGASVIDRYLLGARDRAAAVLRGHARRLVRCSSPARGCAASGSRAPSLLRALRRRLRRDHAEPVEPAQRRSPTRGIPRGPGRARCATPPVKAQLKRCPLVSLPNNKLIPDARWILDSVGQHDIVARSQARADVAQGSHTLEDRIRAAASRSTRSASRVRTKRSSTSATTRATRCRCTASNASTRAATTRCMATAEPGPSGSEALRTTARAGGAA